MAFSNSEPLLQTQNQVSPILMIIIFSLLLLNQVCSQSYSLPSPLRSPSPPSTSPETVSFSFPFFQPQHYPAISLRGDASISGGALQLTKRDNLGNPTQNSIGRAQYMTPVHLWDKTTGNLADFSTKFTFLVNPKGSTVHGDGFTFFLAPIYSAFPTNSNGGYLGLFNPQNAINNTNWNQIVAVEFDTYVNQWDPISSENDNHIGIDVNSIRSALSAPWPELDNGIAYVSIKYNSKAKTLDALVTSKAYPNRTTQISHIVDLRTVLPEWVNVGFLLLRAYWLKQMRFSRGVSRQLSRPP